MSRLFTTLVFARKYGAEIWRCTALTVLLWIELIKLAPNLFNELRNTETIVTPAAVTFAQAFGLEIEE
jgi:hypothetical protein